MAETPLPLAVEGLTVTFGGAVAVDDLDLQAPGARVTGLIGPNGAGKTTTFNACCGTLRPNRGRVRIDGVDVTGSAPQARAQRGLGRTFQRMELFGSLDVRHNVALGREALLAGRMPWHHVVCSPSQRRAIDERTDEALEICGLQPLAAVAVTSLSTGQRRLVELARVVAGGFHVLLLDEPSSGLDVAETEAFGAILQRLVQERGTAILLVEHDMSLVMSVCAYLYVIDFGRLIFEGTPSKVQQSEVVRSAYLGDAA